MTLPAMHVRQLAQLIPMSQDAWRATIRIGSDYVCAIHGHIHCIDGTPLLARRVVPESRVSAFDIKWPIATVWPRYVPIRSQVSVLMRFTSPSLPQVRKKSPWTTTVKMVQGKSGESWKNILTYLDSEMKAIVVEFDEGQRPSASAATMSHAGAVRVRWKLDGMTLFSLRQKPLMNMQRVRMHPDSDLRQVWTSLIFISQAPLSFLEQLSTNPKSKFRWHKQAKNQHLQAWAKKNKFEDSWVMSEQQQSIDHQRTSWAKIWHLMGRRQLTKPSRWRFPHLGFDLIIISY